MPCAGVPTHITPDGCPLMRFPGTKRSDSLTRRRSSDSLTRRRSMVEGKVDHVYRLEQ
jgi:hypothetical protein